MYPLRLIWTIYAYLQPYWTKAFRTIFCRIRILISSLYFMMPKETIIWNICLQRNLLENIQGFHFPRKRSTNFPALIFVAWLDQTFHLNVVLTCNTCSRLLPKNNHGLGRVSILFDQAFFFCYIKKKTTIGGSTVILDGT